MTESFIHKLKSDPDGLDFEGLRKEGIRLAQKISGDVWSDYNLHDPGVTILEVLCYALTDMIYRSGFDAADYLTSEKGTIDYAQQALYRADEIFPCAPLTETDYRKLIINSVPNVDNVWIKSYATPTGELHGVYSAYVQLNEQVKFQGEEGVQNIYKGIVEKLFSANRNLCEDLASVQIVEHIPYELNGEIDIGGQREPSSILADIYCECSHYLNPRIPVQSYAEMYENGHSLEELYSGVLTDQGYIAEELLHDWRGYFSISELIGKISQIEGVKKIRSLSFSRAGDEAKQELDHIDLGEERLYRSIANLHFPTKDEELQIKLIRSGKIFPISFHDVEIEYDKLEYKYQAQKYQKHKLDWVKSILPKTTFRNVSEYYSIQNHFPRAYGVNAFGVPASETPKRKAQATQLKTYLLIFEQLMANFLSNAQEIPKLFSLDKELKQSYFHQVLNNENVPNIDDIYVHGVEKMDAELTKLLAKFDNYGDRRNRVLDYLLGLYGEKLSSNSLRYFFAEDADIADTRITNKIVFLSDIVDINKNRGRAYNYRKPSSNNHSGLQAKLKTLLGLNSPSSASSQNDSEIHIIEHILLRPIGASNHARHDIANDFYSFRLSIVIQACHGPFANLGFRKLLAETIQLNCPAHIYPEIFWLESAQASQFDSLYNYWFAAKCAVNTSAERLNSASAELILFLVNNRERLNA